MSDPTTKLFRIVGLLLLAFLLTCAISVGLAFCSEPNVVFRTGYSKPYIAIDAPGTLPSDGPKGRMLMVRNPTKKTVTVVVRCLDDSRTDLVAYIKGGKRAWLDIGSTQSLHPHDCQIVYWRKWK